MATCRTQSCLCALAALSFLVAGVASVPASFRSSKPTRNHVDAAAADLITSLPGLPKGVKFKQYAGYVDIGGGKEIFYWFVESQRNPAADPLVLWTNGGPGCSGLTGFLSEQGPFRAAADGSLTVNKYAWNKVANMVFIEQPAGVGFSPAPSGMVYSDSQAATDNKKFIDGFLLKFPEYKARDFYLTSESYGGHYLPTLAQKLVASGMSTFKGFAVGNPLTWMPYRDYGQYAQYAARQMVPAPMWQQFVSHGCALSSANESVCDDLMSQMDDLTQDLDPYALDFPTCKDPSLSPGRGERLALMRKVRQAQAVSAGMAGGEVGKLSGYFPHYKPCTDNYMTNYLNKKEVQAAIHVKNPGSVDWAVCADAINEAYSPKDVGAPMMPIYRQLIKGGGLRILVYSGDDDSICSTAGAQLWVWGLGTPVEAWKPWYSRGQVAGYTVAFPGLRFSTVHGAGHMVRDLSVPVPRRDFVHMHSLVCNSQTPCRACTHTDTRGRDTDCQIMHKYVCMYICRFPRHVRSRRLTCLSASLTRRSNLRSLASPSWARRVKSAWMLPREYVFPAGITTTGN